MKLIVGLGNPGEHYAGTKHNMGFDVVDKILDRNGLKLDKQKFQSDYTVWHHGGQKTVLMEPFTYMNLSGEGVLPLMTYFGISLDDLLVIYDDLDLEPGAVRLRLKGGTGGHNGMKSIISMLGTSDFKRIKVGIGRPEGGWKVKDHVLAPFKPAVRQLVEPAIETAASAAEDWARGMDFEQVMNRYN